MPWLLLPNCIVYCHTQTHGFSQARANAAASQCRINHKIPYFGHPDYVIIEIEQENCYAVAKS